MRRGVGQTLSTTEYQTSVSLGAASGDVALTLLTPHPTARVVAWWFRITTVGIGAGTHTITLEVGSAGAGVQIAESMVVTSPGVDESFTEAFGVGQVTTAAALLLEKPGTALQIKNVEGGAATISTGVVGTVGIIWKV